MTLSLDPSQVDALVKVLETRVRAAALEAAQEVGKRFESAIDTLGDALLKSTAELAKARAALEAVDPVVVTSQLEAAKHAQSHAAEVHLQTLKTVEGIEKRLVGSLEGIEQAANSTAAHLVKIVDEAKAALHDDIGKRAAQIEARVDEVLEAEKRSLAAARAHVTKAVVKQEIGVEAAMASLRQMMDDTRAEVIAKVSALPVTPRWRGPFSGDETYAKGDIVIHKRVAYISKGKVKGVQPAMLPAPHPWEIFTAAPKE